MMSGDFDIIVIGAGHNGMIAAANLAQAGQRVLVLERREVLGGIAATEGIFQEALANTGWPSASLLRPEAIAGLELESHGLEIPASKALLFSPNPDGLPITLWSDPATSVEWLKKTAPRDFSAYGDYLDFMRRMAGVLAAMMVLTPPALKGPYDIRKIWPWARVALQARGLGRRDLISFLRVLPLSARELLDEWFDSRALKGALGLFSTLGTMQGPMSPGTALNLLYHHTGRPDPGFVRGGIGNLSSALLGSALKMGVEVRVNMRVRRIIIENGRAAGVQTEDGEEHRSAIVISSAAPGRTLLDLAGAPHLPLRTVRRLRNLRYRGSTATVHLLLSGVPDFGQSSHEQLAGYLTFCPSLDYLEKAYDNAKYGRFSDQPALLGHLPSLADEGFAPPGKHVLSLIVRYAPYQLNGKDWDQNRSALEKSVMGILERYAGGLPDLIESTRTITPLDYERVYGLPEGAWTHGQMALDQLLMMRPIPGLGSYRSPIPGLFLTGSGTHPGGDVTGAPGMNTAREVLLEITAESGEKNTGVLQRISGRFRRRGTLPGEGGKPGGS